MNTPKAAKLILSIMALSVQAFVLLGVLLMISLVELQQQLTQTQQHIKIAPSSSTVKEQFKNKDAPSSPLLLPTPPCEKEVPIPTKMMINGGDPPISDQDDAVVRPAKETKAMAAPNEPAPPLLPATPPDEAISKQQQTTTNDKDNVVNCSEQPVIENAVIELDRQDPLPDIQKPLSNTSMQRKSESNKNSNSTILESPQPALTKNIPSFPSPNEIHEEMMVTTTTPSDMPVHTPNDSSLDLPPVKKHSKDDSTEAPASTAKEQKKDDITSIPSPTFLDSSPLPPSTTPNIELSNDETTKAAEQATEEEQEQEQEQNNVSPVSLPLLSPSASLSSSLSTLNHATNNSTSPHEPSTTGSDGHISRFHRSFIKKQQQQQQQQKQPEEVDPSSPIPISSHSSKTHVSNVSTTPKPLGSSLSMKLNKLKQPGRRISQMFKKKKQPSS
jgi:hypothetical protein